jgi:hypothetical protein
MNTGGKYFWKALSAVARLDIAVGITITVVVLIVLAMEGR